MIAIHTFASGSSGNAALVSWDSGRALLDAGISCRRIQKALASLGTDLPGLDAIFITHTHSDHISGLQTLLKHTACPVFGSAPVLSELRGRFPDWAGRMEAVPFGEHAGLRGCAATAVRTSHDAPGSCGWRFDTAEGSAALLTDTGTVTPEAEALLPGVDLVVLEANHDIEMLKRGPYPYYLKERVLGPKGHLSNADAAVFAVRLVRAGAAEVVLAHLSQENNRPELALQAVETALAEAGLRARVRTAPRDAVCGARGTGRTGCSR